MFTVKQQTVMLAAFSPEMIATLAALNITLTGRGAELEASPGLLAHWQVERFSIQVQPHSDRDAAAGVQRQRP